MWWLYNPTHWLMKRKMAGDGERGIILAFGGEILPNPRGAQDAPRPILFLSLSLSLSLSLEIFALLYNLGYVCLLYKERKSKKISYLILSSREEEGNRMKKERGNWGGRGGEGGGGGGNKEEQGCATKTKGKRKRDQEMMDGRGERKADVYIYMCIIYIWMDGLCLVCCLLSMVDSRGDTNRSLLLLLSLDISSSMLFINTV